MKRALEVDAGDCRWAFDIKYAEKEADPKKLLAEGIEQVRERRYGETVERSRTRQLMGAVLVFSGDKRRAVLLRGRSSDLSVLDDVPADAGSAPPLRQGHKNQGLRHFA